MKDALNTFLLSPKHGNSKEGSAHILQPIRVA